MGGEAARRSSLVSFSTALLLEMMSALCHSNETELPHIRFWTMRLDSFLDCHTGYLFRNQKIDLRRHFRRKL